MRKYVFRIVLLFALVACSAHSPKTADKCHKITEDEIEINVAKFVTVVWGAEVAGLVQYQEFYGSHSEQETMAELRECVSRGWIKAVPQEKSDLRAYEGSPCEHFIRERWNNPTRVPSYYLSFIRDHFPLRLYEPQLNSIHPISAPDTKRILQYRVVVQFGPHSLSFVAAADDCVSDYLSKLVIESVDGKAVTEAFFDYLDGQNRWNDQ